MQWVALMGIYEKRLAKLITSSDYKVCCYFQWAKIELLNKENFLQE